MEILDYLDPVGIEKPEIFYDLGNLSFFRSININTINEPATDWEKCSVFLIGLPEDRNAVLKGASDSVNPIRNKLYQLVKPTGKISICDLGNLKNGKTIHDSYAAISNLTEYLSRLGKKIIFFGGSHDLTYPVSLGLSQNFQSLKISSIDSRIDYFLEQDERNLNNESFLYYLLQNTDYQVLDYANIGHQSYLVSPDVVNDLNHKMYETFRLAEVKNQMEDIEPVLRESHFISFDIASIRQADAPANYLPSPNGFSAEEACQLAKYAGLSNSMNIFGLFELYPKFDVNLQTAGLAAQVIWHCLEGIANHIPENPHAGEGEFKRFLVKTDENSREFTFLKSERTYRWWVEIPVIKSEDKRKVLIACSPHDYYRASQQDIPDRIWRAFQKLI